MYTSVSFARRWLLIGVVLGATSAIESARAQAIGNPAGGIQVSLKITLEKGLRCRRPQEFAYVVRVVEMVDEGALPETLVRNTYGWARRRSGYPLQYFQFALQRQAAALGVEAPTIGSNQGTAAQ